MFDVLIRSNISNSTYDIIRSRFEELQLKSLYQLHSHMSKLSHVVEHSYDCCINSCCCFSSELSNLDTCPYCGQPRFRPNSRIPFNTFHYLQIGPRLKALYLNKHFAELSNYRGTLDLNTQAVDDVFHGSHYLGLLQQQVQIDGQQYPHCFFSDPRDIALGIMTDGFQIFKRQRDGSATCWPIIAINFNLPPEERTKLSNIIPLAIIPGPKAPKDFNSFLRPLVDDCKKLALGEWALDVASDETFKLRAYPISFHGDMIAMKHLTNFKGPNGISPCPVCHIMGVRNLDGGATYYVPHTPPRDQPQTRDTYWDVPGGLLRSESDYHCTLSMINSLQGSARGVKSKLNKIQQQSGINGSSVLTELPSVSIFRSFPRDWMHLCLENHSKNLVALWQGKYKGLDEGSESYRIPDNVWERIGLETALAGNTIPSSFGRRTPNIWTEKHLFTAEDWAFWMIHIAPYVLRNRFNRPKYYRHFKKFNSILKRTVQYSFTEQGLDELEQDIVEYVKEYEM
jgi:hypothetical protein